MIIVTGGAGMIGSAFVWKLNEMGIKDILIVDKLRTENKWLNIRKREYYDWIDKDNLKEWLACKENADKIEAVIHMGACSATTETDADFLMDNNFAYTKFLWNFCAEKNIKYIYASSAATYGMGELGYNDDVSPEELQKLMPLNKYGYSKKFFDDWAFKQKNQPKQWNGLKFFKSYKEGFKDGEQLRDFVYVKDVVDIMYFMLTNDVKSGIYNIGTGKARSFMDLSMATMRAASHNDNLDKNEVVKLIEMPEDLQGKYQYFTEAKINKLREIGYTKEMHSLEEGVKDYVQNYLAKEDSYL